MRHSACKNCPVIVDADNPCTYALERVHAIQADPKGDVDSHPGSDWYIMSKEHGYCFWNYVKDMDGPVPDKEICRLLGITQTVLKETYASAIEKLRANKDHPDVKAFYETVMELSAMRKDDTDYLNDEVSIQGIKANLVENSQDKDDELAIIESVEGFKEDPNKKKRGRKPRGQPLHRDGRKTDIYFARPKK